MVWYVNVNGRNLWSMVCLMSMEESYGPVCLMSMEEKYGLVCFMSMEKTNGPWYV